MGGPVGLLKQEGNRQKRRQNAIHWKGSTIKYSLVTYTKWSVKTFKLLEIQFDFEKKKQLCIV